MLGLTTKRAGIFSVERLCSVCWYAVLTSRYKCETAVDGYNSTLFWVGCIGVVFMSYKVYLHVRVVRFNGFVLLR